MLLLAQDHNPSYIPCSNPACLIPSFATLPTPRIFRYITAHPPNLLLLPRLLQAKLHEDYRIRMRAFCQAQEVFGLRVRTEKTRSTANLSTENRCDRQVQHTNNFRQRRMETVRHGMKTRIYIVQS